MAGGAVQHPLHENFLIGFVKISQVTLVVSRLLDPLASFQTSCRIRLSAVSTPIPRDVPYRIIWIKSYIVLDKCPLGYNKFGKFGRKKTQKRLHSRQWALAWHQQTRIGFVWRRSVFSTRSLAIRCLESIYIVLNDSPSSAQKPTTATTIGSWAGWAPGRYVAKVWQARVILIGWCQRAGSSCSSWKCWSRMTSVSVLTLKCWLQFHSVQLRN